PGRPHRRRPDTDQTTAAARAPNRRRPWGHRPGAGRARFETYRMTKPRRVNRRGSSGSEVAAELEDLRSRLAEAEGILHAIREGEVDAVVVNGEHGDQVYTL